MKFGTITWKCVYHVAQEMCHQLATWWCCKKGRKIWNLKGHAPHNLSLIDFKLYTQAQLHVLYKKSLFDHKSHIGIYANLRKL